MSIKGLTVNQHQQLVARLATLARQVDGVKYNRAGAEYSSLMVCFLLHNLGATEALLRLASSFGYEWFPVTTGYVIDRSVFETMITARYIAQDPVHRSRQYTQYERVIDKKRVDAFLKHRNTQHEVWHEYIDIALTNDPSLDATKIDARYKPVENLFHRTAKSGKRIPFRSWSGKSIREMAVEIDHEIEYDIFYSELSLFAHTNVPLANRFLRIRSDGLSWSQKSTEFDVGNVFRHAAIFFSCFLRLFGEEFNAWPDSAVTNCWEFPVKEQ